MSKYADLYFEVDPWQVRERGFNPSYGQVAESIFSLGNEYMGLRGYFDEGYSGKRLVGSYVNGIYERRSLPKSGYKGMLPFTDFMVNGVDWTYFRLIFKETRLDLATCKVEEFERTLDLKTGLLTRKFIWLVDEKTRLLLTFERFLSMEQSAFGGQRIQIQVLEGEGTIDFRVGLDFSNLHVSMEKNFWTCSQGVIKDNSLSLTGTTHTTKQSIMATAQIEVTGPSMDKTAHLEDQLIYFRYQGMLQGQDEIHMDKIISIYADKQALGLPIHAEEAILDLKKESYEVLKQGTKAWWQASWQVSDIKIDGDLLNQQGIRFCIFQLHQTLHTADHGAVIGAKGLTGEAYNGNTFWDSEVYCLPFYLFNNKEAAKSILKLRYNTLKEAKDRAVALDCQGAFYPIATISGHECCDLWQHASLQLQASTAVMYGIWHYVKITQDQDFLKEMGAEILVEICRMLATRGDYSSVTGKYGYYGVMGPDEFQMMVNNNTYTNFMAKKSFEFTLEVLKDMKKNEPEFYDTLAQRLDLKESELLAWSDRAEKMMIRYDESTKIFEQHEGYYDLPNIDLKSIPVEDFPLYAHWTYDRIYRNNMLKQPDVLMFMLMYQSEFTDEALEANYDYYEPRCIHESSLSPSVHSILANRLGRAEAAYDFFKFATRMDLDNYNRNTNEGLHTTSIAGAWMNIVYGFGGFRSDGPVLTLGPTLPCSWDGYSFRICKDDLVLVVEVTKDRVYLRTLEGLMSLVVYGEEMLVTSQGLTLPLITIRQEEEAAVSK